jgi:hypothetical protein
MTSTELWEAYSTRNPSFDGDGQVTMSAAGLRKLFNQTWSIAYDTGYRTGLREATARAKPTPAPPPEIFRDIFRDIFGVTR